MEHRIEYFVGHLAFTLSSLYLTISKKPPFGGAPKSLQMLIAAMKLKDSYSLQGKL